MIAVDLDLVPQLLQQSVVMLTVNSRSLLEKSDEQYAFFDLKISV